LIFGNIEFWRPIRAEYRIDLKVVSKRPQRILMNLQLLFESVLIEIVVTNSVNVLGGGALCAPLPFLGLIKTAQKETFLQQDFHIFISGQNPTILHGMGEEFLQTLLTLGQLLYRFTFF
jgi:hypothetical protein